MADETVAVVIPVFNGAAVIERAIQSVLDQTVPIAEIIVVDDGSTDDTVAVVERLAKAHPAINLVRQPQNGGVSKARNAGNARATADWVAILDGDDTWRPERTEKLLELASRYQANFVADNMVLHDLEAGVDFRVMMAPKWGAIRVDQETYWRNCRVGGPQFAILKPMIRRDFMETSGLEYDEEIGNGQDLIFQGEALALGARAVVTSKAWYVYSARQGVVSGKMNKESRTNMNFEGIADRIEALVARRADLIPPPAKKQALICRDTMRAMHRINVYRASQKYDRPAAALNLLTDQAALRLFCKIRYRKWRVTRPDYAV